MVLTVAMGSVAFGLMLCTIITQFALSAFLLALTRCRWCCVMASFNPECLWLLRNIDNMMLLLGSFSECRDLIAVDYGIIDQYKRA